MLPAKGQLKLLAIQQKGLLGCAQRFRPQVRSGEPGAPVRFPLEHVMPQRLRPLKKCRPLVWCVAMKSSLIGASFFVFAPAVVAQTMPLLDSAANTAHQISRVRAETALTNTRVPFHASWDSLAAYRTPDWFRDAKFGIFLHWGVYSVPAFGNEWYSRNIYVPGSPANKHQVETY